MIAAQVRRSAFALALGISSFTLAGAATTPAATPTGTVTNNGVTGTDPVPPGCGCKGVTQPPSTSTVAPSTTLGAAAQAFLAMLGLG